MRPIKKKFLIHSAILKGNVVEDKWGNILSSDDILLENIRIEPTDKVVLTNKTNKEIKLDSLIFFDITNSKPKGVEFKTDSTIIFGDFEYTIKKVMYVYDRNRLHHYEIGVV